MLVIKADILALMHEKQKLISEAMSPRDYVLACVEVMFEVAAEVLATEPDSDEVFDMKAARDKVKKP